MGLEDGFYEEEDRPAQEGPKQKQKVLTKIPASVCTKEQK